MTIRFNTAMRNAMVNALTGAISGSTLSIYTGSQPATANDAATGTKLVDITINGFNAPADGSATLDTSTPNNGIAVATGTAGWGRIVGLTGERIDGTVGTSGADFTINSTSITNGATVTLTAMTVTQPAS
jgi:hypothetical protein